MTTEGTSIYWACKVDTLEIMFLSRDLNLGYLDEHSKEFLQIKVGRTTNPSRRLQQWRRQCPGANYLLLGFWPDGLDLKHPILESQIVYGQPTPNICRLEALIKVILAMVARHPPWLKTEPPAPERIICSSCK